MVTGDLLGARDQALTIIDNALTITIGRELLGADEVADLLLDLRTLLSEEDSCSDPA